MAKPKKNAEQTNITRVKANDDKKPVKTPKDSEQKKAVVGQARNGSDQNFLQKFFGYFRGSWHELKQVRWHDRRATWGMTAALLTFTAFFIVLILVVDTLWEYLFKLILE